MSYTSTEFDMPIIACSTIFDTVFRPELDEGIAHRLNNLENWYCPSPASISSDFITGKPIIDEVYKQTSLTFRRCIDHNGVNCQTDTEFIAAT